MIINIAAVVDRTGGPVLDAIVPWPVLLVADVCMT